MVKSFKFSTNDVIICEYDPSAMKVNFTKEKTKEKYSLEVKNLDNDPLHPCVLFYY